MTSAGTVYSEILYVGFVDAADLATLVLVRARWLGVDHGGVATYSTTRPAEVPRHVPARSARRQPGVSLTVLSCFTLAAGV